LEITVNSEKIDYTLENEKSLGDVVRGIESWLNNSRLVITSMKVGPRDLTSEPEPQWAGIPLDDVSRLDITARLYNEVQISQLELMQRYLQNLKSAVASGKADDLDAAMEGFEDIVRAMREALDINVMTRAGRGLQDLHKLLTGSSAQEVNAWPTGIKEKVIRVLSDLLESVGLRLRETQRPAQTLRSTAEELRRSAFELEEVSVLLQQNEDEKAMSYVVRFSELVGSIVRMVSILAVTEEVALDDLSIGGEPVRSFLESFNGILKELVEAFTARDTVLIGDLLEYEISPRLDSLVSFLLEFEPETQ
jgi:hypothetical protein